MSTIDSVIAGAVYDFAAYLTALKTPVEFGSTKDAAPAAEAVKAWLDAHGLRPTNDPNLPWRRALSRVATQYRNPDTGEWCNFASALHERATIACGEYELRDLYTITAQPPGSTTEVKVDAGDKPKVGSLQEREADLHALRRVANAPPGLGFHIDTPTLERITKRGWVSEVGFGVLRVTSYGRRVLDDGEEHF